MAGLIKIAVSGGGKNNKAPTIKNFRQEGKIETTCFDIKYIAEDFENTILRHYIYVDAQKKEITKNVGYESVNNEFTYRVNNLSMGTTYNIQLEVTDGIDTVRSDILSIKTTSYPTFGIKVMENNSNPKTCCTHIENSIDIIPANSTSLGGWKDKFPFNKIRMVGFKSGKVTKEINPTNKTKYIDGSSVETDVDVMVEIPRVYWDFKSIENGYELRISEIKFNDNCDCYAHKVNGIEKDFIYIGAYLGCIENGKLRSKSGSSPITGQTINWFRGIAQANGSGYQQFNWFSLVLLQILYLIAYKSLDSQTALGYGFANSNSIAINSGGTDTKGFVFGETSGKQQMCFLGIEDFWGNLYQWVDGMKTDNQFNVLVVQDNKSFNDAGNGYKNLGKFVSGNGSGYIANTSHTNESVFFPKIIDGSETTHYCDYSDLSANCITIFGGNWNSSAKSGAFCLSVLYGAFGSDSKIGSRLCYL